MRTAAGLAVVVALALPGAVPSPAGAGDTEPRGSSARATTTVDDRALARSGTWRNKSFAGAHAGTLSKSKDKGATLTSAATTGGGKVVLQFGPGRGKVDVRVAGVKQKSIDTSANKKKLKTVPFSGNGVVVLKVKKPGKGIYVDALVLTLAAPPGPPAPAAGEVIVTEWLSNPDAIPEANGEWFELHNVSGSARSLAGCTVTNQAAGSVALPAATLPPGGRYLVARSADTGTNGGITPNATFTFSLTTNGSLTLSCGATAVDGVTWTGETSGQTASLDPDFYTAAGNDVPANYCVGTVPYGNAGDLGTPGEVNTQCGSPPGPPPPFVGEVFVTEVMANPSAVGDTDGEWFELHSLASTTRSLTGCTVTSQSAGTVTLPTATIEPSSPFVLARNSNTLANGGVTANATFTFSLVDANGSLTLACGATTLDVVSWTSATSGKSRSLSSTHYSATDNDTPTNFCDATAAYGLGDLGTPGAVNPACP